MTRRELVTSAVNFRCVQSSPKRRPRTVDMLGTYSLALAFASPLSPPKIPDTFTAVVTSTTSGTSSVEPKGKATMKQFCALLRSAPALEALLGLRSERKLL